MKESLLVGVGFVVDLEELDAVLSYISHDEHHWEI